MSGHLWRAVLCTLLLQIFTFEGGESACGMTATREFQIFPLSTGLQDNGHLVCHTLGGEPVTPKIEAENDNFASLILSTLNVTGAVRSPNGMLVHTSLLKNTMGDWEWSSDSALLDTMCWKEFASAMPSGCVSFDPTRPKGSRWVDDRMCNNSNPRYACEFDPSAPPCSPPTDLYNFPGFWTTTDPLTYSQAEAFCAGFGGKLAYMYTEQEVDDAAWLAPTGGLWMGLRYNRMSGTHVWASGEQLGWCHSVRLSEPTLYSDVADTCYLFDYDPDYDRWRYEARDCAGTVNGAICRVPLCNWPYEPPCMSTDFTYFKDSMLLGSVVNFTCNFNWSVTFSTTCSHTSGIMYDWVPHPNTFVCPDPVSCPAVVPQTQQYIRVFPRAFGAWKPADRFCRSLGGSLVIARTEAENNLFQTVAQQTASAANPPLPLTWIGRFHLGIQFDGVSNYTWVDGARVEPMCRNPEMFCWPIDESCMGFDSRENVGDRWFDYECYAPPGEIYYACQSNQTLPDCSVAPMSTIDYAWTFAFAPMTRAQAEGICLSMRATLASYHSETDLNNAFMYSNTMNTFWIGLKFNYTTNTYVWDDGTNLGWCDPIRLVEPIDATNASAMGNGLDCFKAVYNSNSSGWRYVQESCSSTSVSGAACKAVKCPYPPSITYGVYNFTHMADAFGGSVISYSCIWSSGVFSTTCTTNGTWAPDPGTFSCPGWNPSKLTLECFKGKALANPAKIYTTKPVPLSTKKCSTACVRDTGCHGVYLKPWTGETQLLDTSSNGQDIWECNLFLLNVTISAMDMVLEVGSTVCRHVYRDASFSRPV